MTATAPDEVFLAAGDLYFGQGRVRIRTLLGTCIAITLWHPLERRGGMCHFLLPARGLPASGLPARGRHSTAEPGPGFYAEEVMGLFDDELRASRTDAKSYIVKIFGGGHMFPDQLTDLACRNNVCTDAARARCSSVGCQNIRAAQRLLPEHGFSVASEQVGGHGSRQVMFDLWNGHAWMKRGAAMVDGTRIAV
jgi:chemotaxis protein CheD